MGRIPQISGREMVKILIKAGFYFVGQESSHIKLRRPYNEQIQTVIIPDHKEIRQGTFRNILRMVDLSLVEFEKLRKKKSR